MLLLSLKKIQRKEIGKDSLISLRKEFDTEEEGKKYISDNFSEDFTFDLEFTRTGWQYDLGEDQIDLEKVEDIRDCYTIEIKSKTVGGLQRLACMFELDSFVKTTTLGEIKKLLSKKVKK